MAAATRSLRWLALAVAARAARHHHATPRFADADAVVRPAAGTAGPTPRFFFVLGVEGTGHHFWTELGAKLNGGELDRLPEEARRRVDGVLTEVTSCFFSLSQPRTPRPCPGCEARQICAFRWRADPWPTGKALAVNGCSYPCGARDRGNANNLFKYTSPDFPRVARELQGSKRVIQRRFNVSLPRARVTENTSTLRERSERRSLVQKSAETSGKRPR